MDEPDEQRRVKLRTIILRPHPSDWLPLKYGERTEFRSSAGFPNSLHTPTPCVLRRQIASRAETMMWVIEEAWREPLGSISDESLARSGCASFAEFRELWAASRRIYFDATMPINVYRGRPWTEDDREPMALRLLETMYGPFLP